MVLLTLLSRGSFARYDVEDCLVYRVVSKSLERIADHATTIARMSASIESPLPPRLIDEISKASDLTISFFEEALKSLTNTHWPLATLSTVSADASATAGARA